MLDSLRLKVAQTLLPKSVDNQGVQLTLMSPTVSTTTYPRLGTSELLAAYSKMPWLRALTNKVGKSVGSTHWTLLSVNGSSSKQEIIRPFKLQRAPHDLRKSLITKYEKTHRINEIEDHPLLKLISKGNSIFPGQTVFQLIQTYIDLVGEAFVIKERNILGTPVNLWPLPSDWIKSFPTSDNFTYELSLGGVRVDVPMSEVIAFIDPDPKNPYGRGTGIAWSLGDELETDEYAAKHLKNFFLNSARPDMIISGDNLGISDTKRLEERWLEKHKGFWNRFKPHFLSRKVDIHELGQSFENMQMVEIRKHERDMFIQVYGFPPEKFGIVGESKRSTIAAADLFWQKDVLTPRLEYIRMVLQEKLVPDFDDRIVLDYELPEVQDDEHRLNVMKSAPWAFKRNEWRGFIGADEDKERGDVYVQQLNQNEVPANVSIDEVPSAPPKSEPIPDDTINNNAIEDLKALSEQTMQDAITDKVPEMIGEVKRQLLLERNNT